MVAFSTVLLRLLLWRASYAIVSAQLTVTTLPNVLFQSNDGVHNIVEESVVWLYCTANSTIATPSITWTKNGVTLVHDPPHIRIRSSSDDTNMSTTSSLVIDNFKTSDNGSYMCQAGDGTVTMNSSVLSLTGFGSGNNTLFVVTTPASNEITFERHSILPLDNRTAVPLGSTVDPAGTANGNKLLRCVAGHMGDTGPESFSPPSVVWVKNGEQVVADSRITINENLTFSGQQLQSVLQISNFSFSDVGVYQCIFTDVDSDAEVITTTPLRLDTGDVLGLKRVSPELIVLDPPEKLVIETQALGGYRQIQWTRTGQPFSPNPSDPFFVRLPDEFSNFFEIFVREPTTIDDRYGVYTVELLVTGSGQIQAMPLNFFVTPYDPPEIMPYNQNATVMVLEGNSVNISCASVGHPIPTILWELNGSPAPFPQSDTVTDYQAVIPTIGEFNFTDGDVTSVLTIANIVFPDHEGEYTCKGRNSHKGVESSAYSNITVHVLVIPEVQLAASPPIVLIGRSTTLTCNVTRANPTDYTTFTWTLNSTALSETGNTLTLSPVRESDLGVYHCKVTNSAGTGIGTFNLALVRDEDPGVVPLTTIIAAVCSVAVASLLLLVAVITILTIWKLKYRNSKKVHANIDMQANPVYGLPLPDRSLSEHRYGTREANKQTSNVDDHVYAPTSTVTTKQEVSGTTEKHNSTSENKYDYAIVTTSSSIAENHGYTTVDEKIAPTAVYDEATSVTESVGKSLEHNGRQISATDHGHVTHGYVNVSQQTSAIGKNIHDETIKTSALDDHVYDQPVSS